MGRAAGHALTNLTAIVDESRISLKEGIDQFIAERNECKRRLTVRLKQDPTCTGKL